MAVVIEGEIVEDDLCHAASRAGSSTSIMTPPDGLEGAEEPAILCRFGTLVRRVPDFVSY
jgi:hypothetical protein